MSLFTGAATLAAALAGTASTITAAKIGSGASKTAGEVAARSTHEALDYTKQKDAEDTAHAKDVERANYDQYVAREKRLTPYRATGQAANQTLSHLLGLPDVTVAPPPPMPDYLRQDMTPTTRTATVRLKAPTGEVKEVPQSDAQFFLSRGATVI